MKSCRTVGAQLLLKAAATSAVGLAESTAAEVSRFVSDAQTALASLSRRPMSRLPRRESGGYQDFPTAGFRAPF